MDTPGIFCTSCHEGQWHWDCQKCGARQDFSACFFYDENKDRRSLSLGCLEKATGVSAPDRNVSSSKPRNAEHHD
jgi:hypothetical protein